MRWLDGIVTRWTWVWVSSRSWWWTGKPGVLQSNGVTNSWTRLSNWTELNCPTLWLIPLAFISPQDSWIKWPLQFLQPSRFSNSNGKNTQGWDRWSISKLPWFCVLGQVAWTLWFSFFLIRKQCFFFFNFFFFISWRLITLLYCSEFCHTLKWISHGFTCISHPDPPSYLPLHPIPLGLPRAPGLSTCLMHPTWAQVMVICFTLDNIDVSMLFSRNIPPSPSWEHLIRLI